jgi:ubiquinone/menaquinone biosynthesis C-methylase UbiE
MNHSEATATPVATSAESFYDRIARVYDLTYRFNRYGDSVERLLRENPLPLSRGARVLDAGCGTGLLTLALLRVYERPLRVSAVDLSGKSLLLARRAVEKQQSAARHDISFTQANVLSLPFDDATFEFVMSSGVLEYVPLAEGMRELARVIAPGGYFLHLPVVPSPVSKLIELIYRFRLHPPREVEAETARYFRVLKRHRFAAAEPIGWTKMALLAQRT